MAARKHGDFFQGHQGRLGATRPGLILWLGVVVLSLVVGGYAYFLRESRVIRREKYNDLKAIADLKVGQIVAWRNERTGDTRVHAARSLFRTAVLERLQSPAGSQPKNGLREHLESLVDAYGYTDVILARADGTVFLSLDPRLTSLDPTAKDLIARTVASGGIEFGDFFRCPACHKVHLDVAAPIQGGEGRTAAVLILRSDPEDHLYPLLQSWPTPSQSAETLIVRKDGDDVLFLNRLRHVPDPPLTRRIPLSGAEVPAVRAALGQAGECEGPDYRGVDVLADIRPVPGSPWFMVAKVDASEILAEVEHRGYIVFLFVFLATLVTGAVVAVVFHNGRRALYENLYHTERRRREAQEEIRITLYSIGDAVIATDAAGRVTRMNPVAERLTGWPEADALGEPLDRVFHIVNEETRAEVENPVTRVMREGVVVGLANHTSLLARDGAEHPIADSGAPMRDEKGRIIGVVLVFRDQTGQRRAERAVQTERDNLRALLAASPVGIFVLDDEELVVDANPAAERMLQTSLAEMTRRRCGDLIACINRHKCPDGCGHSENCPDCALFAAVREALVAGQGVHEQDIEVVREFADGPRPVWFTFSVAPVVLNGRRHAIVALDDITGRKRAEEALLQSEERYRQLADNTPDVIWQMGLDRRLTYANPAIEAMFGYTVEEFVGSSLDQHCTPERLQEIEELLAGQLAGPEGDRGVIHQTELLHRDGRTIPVEVHASVLRAEDGRLVGVQGITRDLTERRRAEESLRESEERHRSLVACSMDAVLLTSPDGGILAANEAACRMFGRSEDELIEGGRACIVDESDPRLAAALDERARTGRFRGELNLVRKDGTRFPGELSSMIFADRLGNPRTSMTIRDLTERRRAERSLRESEERFRRALENMPDVLVIYDRDLTIRYINQATRQVSGRPPSDFIGRRDDEVWPPEVYQVYLPTLREARETGTICSLETEVALPGVGARNLVVTCVPLTDEKGEVREILGITHDFTERKRAEEETARASREWQTTFDATNDAIWILDKDHRVLRSNATAERLFRSFREPMIGRICCEIVHGGAQPLPGCPVLRARESLRRETLELRSGDAWLEVVADPILDAAGRYAGAVHIVSDITHRKRAEEELRWKTAFLEAQVNASLDGILVVDEHARRILTNQRLVEMWAIPPGILEDPGDEVLLRYVRSMVKDPEAFYQRVVYLYAHPDATSRDEIEFTNGMVFDRFSSPVLGQDGRYYGRIWTFRDVTDRTEAARALLEATHAAQAANRAKSEFLANMSHEIRTPMTAILGFSELLSSSRLSPGDQRQFLEGIHRNGEALMSLLNDILDLSRIEAGKMTAETADYPLRQIMEDVLTVVRLRAEEKGLSLEVDYAREVPETVHTDPARLRQILVNLVGNAIKFTDRGEVRIGVRCTGEAGSPERLEFAVSDTGIGIPAEKLACLFQPFTQADTSSTRLFGGVGLGLAISKRLAAMLGGGIEVASESGKGSTFTLTIENAPLVETAPAGPVAAGGRSPETRQSVLQGRVLLAEDVPDVQRAIAQILRAANLEVDIAENGLAACRMAERSRAEGRAYDVVLMDIRMPEMDGYEATQWLRQHGWEGPIVALTAYALASDREKCLAAGCSDYLPKPFTMQQLEEVLARYLTK